MSVTALTTIVIPDSATDIKPYAFDHCHDLTSIVLPITKIEENVFEGCRRLATIIIPNSLLKLERMYSKNKYL